jgi:hypothetical protein
MSPSGGYRRSTSRCSSCGGARRPDDPNLARRCAALAPHGAFVEIDGAGHAAHVSHPDRVAQLVERLLAEGDDRVGEVVGRFDHGDVTHAG